MVVIVDYYHYHYFYYVPAFLGTIIFIIDN